MTNEQALTFFGWLWLTGIMLFVMTWVGLVMAAKSGRFSLTHWSTANWLWCVSFLCAGGAGSLWILGWIVIHWFNGQPPALIQEGGIFIAAGVWIGTWVPWFQFINRMNIRHEWWQGFILLARRARTKRRNRYSTVPHR